jgi:CBS domain containing-hemolysin-like protein
VAHALHFMTNMKRASGADWGEIPISAVILPRMHAVSPEQPLEDVAQLLCGGRMAKVPVMDHGVPLGVVTRDEMAGTLESLGPETPIGMTTLRDVVVVSPSDSLDMVLQQLHASPGALAIVMDGGAVFGVVTEEQLAAYVAHRNAA